MPSNFDRRSFIAGTGSLATASLLATAARAAIAPEFVGLTGWINSAPLTMLGLRGRPVLVNFFARSCSNCIATMPYLERWYEAYRERGFVIVGVHTPEFDVEKPRAALEATVTRFGLTYPIAQDNDSATWNAWGNRYWPAEYLVDKNGRIVRSHIGEGGYAETEALIRRLSA
jgi:thiol-disulfide isomerase/thioredoxin